MKRAALFLVVISLLPAVCGHVMITEVMYNPVTSESDTEYVELYNQGDAAVDVGGWYLNTTSVQMTLPEGTVIGANKSFLIADEDDAGNWPASWPTPDYALEEITLGNTDSGVQLVDSTGNKVDTVGWGNPAEDLFETSPHPDVTEGMSLARMKVDELYVDTENNFDDFEEQAPTPQSSSSVQQDATEIVIEADVYGYPPHIDSVIITPDDSADLGIQVMPAAGAEKTIRIEAIVTDSDDNIASITADVDGDVYSMEFVEQINITASLYATDLGFMFFKNPGQYDVIVTAEDADGSNDSANTSFEYLSLTAYDIDADYVLFGGMAGAPDEILGDLNMSTAGSPTLKNLGNTPLDFILSGTDLISPLDIITVDNLQYTFLDGDFADVSAGVLGYTEQQVDVNLGTGENMLRELTLKLMIPSSVASGRYSGSLFISGVAS